MPNKDRKDVPVDIPLTGKLRTYIDPLLINRGDFSVLKNMRYTTVAPKGIAGMAKINTVAPACTSHKSAYFFHKTNPQEQHMLVQSFNDAKNACVIQEQTQEIPTTGNFSAAPVYTIATTWAAGTSYAVGDLVFPTANNGKYYECMIAGVSGGSEPLSLIDTEYESITDNTVAWVCRTGDLVGTFSKAPDGCVAYANGKQCLIWGGNEYRTAAFVNYDPNGQFIYDYTDRINDDRSDALGTAVLYPVSGGIDPSTSTILHCDDNLTDSSPKAHAWSGVIAYTATAKFGTKALSLNGATQYITTPAHADFDFHGGACTIEMWFYSTGGGPKILYSQGNSNGLSAKTDYMKMYLTSGTEIEWDIYVSGALAFSLKTGAIWAGATWNHVAFCEDGNNYYIFFNGVLSAYATSAVRTLAYTGDIFIGCESDYITVPTLSNFYNSYLDEIRISNVARYKADFSVQTTTFGTDNQTYLDIGSALPGITAIKAYVNRPNTSVGTPTFYYWDSSAFQSIGALTDATSSGGVSLAKTGTISFSSTLAVAKPRMLHNKYLYWFRVIWSALDNVTSIYRTTLKTVMQPVVDLWDGQYNGVTSVQVYTVAAGYKDYTTNAIKQDAAATLVNAGVWDYPPETVIPLDSFATTSKMYLGFSERIIGWYFYMPSDRVNATVAAPTIKYWDGQGFVSMGTVDDQTADITKTKTLSNNGFMICNDPGEENEFQTHISTATDLYYYEFSFSAILTANLKIDFVAGIRSPKSIKDHTFPIFWMNSLWLCGNKSSQKNQIWGSAANTVSVFNGNSSVKKWLGTNEDLVSGCTLFSRYGSDVTESFIVHKQSEVRYVNGNNPDNIVDYKIAGEYGNVAPRSLCVCDLGYEIAPGINKAVAIWQAQLAVVMFDNGAIIDISDDIKNFFLDKDKSVTDRVNPLYADRSYSFFSSVYLEYHWCFADGLSTGELNREFVYDLTRRKFFEIDRTSSKKLQGGLSVTDIVGNHYSYGFIDTGHIERLEYGTTFDGVPITCTMRLDEKPSNPSIIYVTETSFVRVIGTTIQTTGRVTVTYFLDGDSGTNIGSFSQASTKSRYNAFLGSIIMKGVTHGLEFSVTTDDVTCGFQPLVAGMMTHIERIDKGA